LRKSIPAVRESVNWFEGQMVLTGYGF